MNKTHPFKVGDKVRAREDASWPPATIRRGEIYTVEAVDFGGRSGEPVVGVSGTGRSNRSLTPFFAERFELVESAEIPRVPPALEEVVVLVDRPQTTRSYDFNQGDVRKYDRIEAIHLAEERTKTRGCRQQVRLDSAPLYEGQQVWLVQDVA